MLLIPSECDEWRPVYRLLTALVQPRPIAWVSSLSMNGVANLAPFSFFNVVCAKPPTVVFCPMWQGPQAAKKDTLANIEATGEFVIQVVSGSLAEKMNLTACEVSSEVSEFDLASLTKAPSKTVSVPRVAEAKAFLECKLDRIVSVGEGSGAGCMILGEVLCIEIDDSVMTEGDRVSGELLDPIGRLAGSEYCHTSRNFAMERPTPEQVGRPSRS